MDGQKRLLPDRRQRIGCAVRHRRVRDLNVGFYIEHLSGDTALRAEVMAYRAWVELLFATEN